MWDSIQAGDATYAEAYKQVGDTLIILVTNQLGVNYYVYVSGDGGLQDIRVNTEDGMSVLNQ